MIENITQLLYSSAIPLNTILVLILVHYISDYILQTDKMSILKSTSIKWLCYHCIAYSLLFFWWGWQFAVVNGILHFVTDFLTFRNITLFSFENKEKRQWYYSVRGLDQAIHFTGIYITYCLIVL